MTLETIELLRNIYSAGAGAAHPSAAAAAIFGLMWNNAWNDGLAAGQTAQNAGASDLEINRAFHQAFAETLGWSDAQSREFWNNHAHDITASDAQAHDAAWDAFDDFVAHMRRGSSGGR
jgi:hypothetical protein